MEKPCKLGSENINWRMQKNCYSFGYVGWVSERKAQAI